MDDYPNVVGKYDEATGRLTHDIEGRPLGASFVVGRRMAGAPDEALTTEGVYSVAKEALGIDPMPVTSRQIGGDNGRLGKAIDPATGEMTRAKHQ